MDRRIKDGLEEYLHGAMEPARKADFERMLNASDHSTRQTVEAIERQTRMLRQAFRPAEQPGQEIGPQPGFYGRVMEHIQSQRSASIWSAFLEPQFFKRLAFASAALLLLLSLTMFTGSPVADEDSITAASVAPVMQTIAQDEAEQQLGESQEEDRDVILVNLATYQQE